MPLLKSASKKALEKNIETEMDAHPGKDRRAQNLAIAYEVQRKARAKKARGGEIKSASMRPDADSRDEREMDMISGESLRHGMEEDAKKEAMELAGKRDKRSMDMLEAHSAHHDARVKLARGGEIDAKREKMVTIDDEDSERSESMLDDHRLMRGMEKKAASRHSVADDSDDMEMSMLHQELQPDEYSKEGIINYADGGEVDMYDENDEPMDVVEAIMRRRMASGGEVDIYSNADEDLNNEDQMSFRAGREPVYAEEEEIGHLEQPRSSNLHSDDEEMDSHDEHDMVDSIRRKIMRAKR